MVKYCSNCGTKLDDEDEFCKNCGEKQTSKQNTNSIIIIAGLVILIIILGIVLMATMKADSELIITSGSAITADDEFSVKLTGKDTALAGKNIHIVFKNGETTFDFNRTTDENGKASLIPEIPLGNYTVTCRFDGDDKYSACDASGEITVKEAEPDYMSYEPFISFVHTDSNGNGYVEYNEMNLAHTPINIGTQMFSDSDEDGDGRLNDYEYHKFMYILNNERPKYGLEEIHPY